MRMASRKRRGESRIPSGSVFSRRAMPLSYTIEAVFWWDDESATPGSVPHQIIRSPVTGRPIRAPLQYLAVLEGCAFFRSDGKIYVDWFQLLDSRRANRQIPIYCGLTEHEIETFQKLREDVMVTHRFVSRIFNISPPLALRFLIDAKIPVYLIGRERMFFCGDLARWLEARRMKADDEAEVELRYYAKEWGKQQAKEGNFQAARHARRVVWSNAAAKSRASREDRRADSFLPSGGAYDVHARLGYGRKSGPASEGFRWNR